MTEPLTLERFRELADAYGGVVARWPEQHRDAALRMAAQPVARDILEQASALDEILDSWRVPVPSEALRNTLAASAPRPRGRLVARARLWWSGIGIAAALAGATAGAAAVAIVSPVDAISDGSTSFGDVGAQGS